MTAQTSPNSDPFLSEESARDSTGIPGDSGQRLNMKESANGHSRVAKRRLNTLAARRYRQRRVDQVRDLEVELEKVKRERDEFRLRVSKLEGETDVLRGLLDGRCGSR